VHPFINNHQQDKSIAIYPLKSIQTYDILLSMNGCTNEDLSKKKGKKMKERKLKRHWQLLSDILFALLMLSAPALTIWIIFNGYPF